MPTGLLAGLLPPEVALAESNGEVESLDLYPEESAAVATAAVKRRLEYAAVRRCARTAMVALGLPPVAIPPDVDAVEPWARRAPIWPAELTGSMTHCEGYAGAAISRLADVAAVGIDAEVASPLPESVLPRVALPQERAMLARLAVDRPEVAWDRLLFSAKESVFKAWYLLARRWLDFEDCRLEIDREGGLRAMLLVPGPIVDGLRLGSFEGRWRATAGHVGTVILVQRRSPPP